MLVFNLPWDRIRVGTRKNSVKKKIKFHHCSYFNIRNNYCIFTKLKHNSKMKKLVLILSLCSIGAFAQKTENRNLTSPFSNTEYVSGAFGSIVNKAKDSFQIVKDKDSEKYAILFEENQAIMNMRNGTSKDTNGPAITKSVIFDNKTQLLELYGKIEKAIKDNTENTICDVNGTTVIINYLKIPLVPGTASLDVGPKGEVSSSFGMNKNRWKSLFAEVK